MSSPGDSVTRVLRELKAGDSTAPDRLAALVYGTLHTIAERLMLRERAGHSLGATALADSAFMRLVGQDRANWQEREQFFARGTEEMRRILIDHHRARARIVRKPPGRRVDMEQAERPSPTDASPSSGDGRALLSAALERFAAIEPRAAEGVMLRLWGNCSDEQIAECQGVSRRTVQQDWAFARAWLRRDVGGDEGTRCR